MAQREVLDFRSLQDEVTAWRKHNFPKADSASQFKGVVEELGELAHADLKHGQKIRSGEGDYYLKKMDAVGDMIIFLLNYCDLEGLDFEGSVKFAWSEASKRDWIKFPKNGVSE